jgi:predicted glycogen debranching enzyme
MEGKNATVVKYKIKNGANESKLVLLPLINYRDYHSERFDFNGFSQSTNSNKIYIKLDDSQNRFLTISSNEGYKFNENVNAFYNMYYAKEAERGLNSAENQYMPGSFEIVLNPHEEKVINIIFTTEEDTNFNLNLEYEKVLSRPAELITKAGFKEKIANELVKAADKFIVYRKSTDGKTILAGYPWFTDWGRDTLIALTGLTITTKRYDDAKSIINTFAKYVRDNYKDLSFGRYNFI